jgi:hypothetical protein
LQNDFICSQRELLAAKLLEIGKSVLSNKDIGDGVSTLDAVKWLQKAFAIIEKLEDSATPGPGQLKVCWWLYARV